MRIAQMRSLQQARRTLIHERGARNTCRHCLVNEANACGLLEKETVESEHERFREETALWPLRTQRRKRPPNSESHRLRQREMPAMTREYRHINQ
jgi:hypothetical protein